MTLSVERLVQLWLESVGFLDAEQIAALSHDRELDLTDGPACIYRETNHAPQLSLDGWTGLSLHSYQVVIFGHDATEVSTAVTDLKDHFRPRPYPLYKPLGWVSGEAFIEAGELRDGSTDETPEIASDRLVVQKTLTIDLWFQE